MRSSFHIVCQWRGAAEARRWHNPMAYVRTIALLCMAGALVSCVSVDKKELRSGEWLQKAEQAKSRSWSYRASMMILPNS
jgi:hypothetical protein